MDIIRPSGLAGAASRWGQRGQVERQGKGQKGRGGYAKFFLFPSFSYFFFIMRDQTLT